MDFIRVLSKKLKEHNKNLNKNNIQTLLLHDVEILFTKNGKKIFRNLEELKKKKYLKKIGISIYDFDCLNYVIPKFNIDVVPIFIEREQKDSFVMYVNKPISSSSYKEKLGLTKKLNEVLEEMILKNPNQWIWTHDRWK